MLGAASVEHSSDRAVIGRRVSVSEDDGSRAVYALVIPGDGDPSRRRLGVDSPMGAALLGATVGERVVVDAPAGRRALTVLAVC
jgi:transcription elongation GreA/GreB family factor